MVEEATVHAAVVVVESASCHRSIQSFSLPPSIFEITHCAGFVEALCRLCVATCWALSAKLYTDS